MLGTAVPKTAVDKKRDARPREHDISLASHPGNGANVHAEPQAPTMKRRAQGDLWKRVPGRLTLHSSADVGGRRRRRSSWPSLHGSGHPLTVRDFDAVGTAR
jgi:hypothetical protein